MVSLKEKRQMKLMHATIKKLGICTASEIQEACNHMSISNFLKLKPYFMEEYEGRIEYHRATKLYEDLNPTEVMKEQIQQVLDNYRS